MKLFWAWLSATMATAVYLLLCVALSHCTPAERAGIPALSTLDAIGMGVAQIAGWCEKRGISPATVDSARKLAADKDYPGALALLADLVAKSRAAGDPIPAEVEMTLRLAEGAAASSAVEQGMRALSGRAPDGTEKPK